jgi:hypothetical protein
MGIISWIKNWWNSNTYVIMWRKLVYITENYESLTERVEYCEDKFTWVACGTKFYQRRRPEY